MGKFMRDGSGSWGWSRFRGAGRVGRTCSSEYGRIMIRPTRHPATMPHRAVPRQRGLAGLVLLLLGMSVLSVCVAGYADAGTSQMAGSGWSCRRIGHRQTRRAVGGRPNPIFSSRGIGAGRRAVPQLLFA